MRLKYVEIGKYKNFKDFKINFESDCFIDVFVGKNGCGKSNFFEALILIFNHLSDFGKNVNLLNFSYQIIYELEHKEHKYIWNGLVLNYNNRNRKTVTESTLPDNILVYYAGHNHTISNIINKYQDQFRKRIIKAEIDESRKIIGIDTNYKSILLGILLLQPDTSTAKRYICKKLGIRNQLINICITLKRPVFARNKKIKIDRFEETTFYWGIEGIALDFIQKLVSCTKESFNHASLYSFDKDSYTININGELYRELFKDIPATEQFRSFDNLNTLDMLSDIQSTFDMIDLSKAEINQFSDGQFQTVYIYSILEFFRDRRCLLLLDEPDSFLHPEWQHEFFTQVLDITEQYKKKNHILMSSHSASTIAPIDTSMLSINVIENNLVKQRNVAKSEVIQSLSGGNIIFTTEEASLNINYIIDRTDKHVLFTEGITDEIILKTAWKKLYPNKERPFEVQNAFSCGFLRNLVNSKDLYKNYPNKIFFALFDFDEAYSDWNQLGCDIEKDPHKCLIKKKKGVNLYSILLPVPEIEIIKKQVINPNTKGNYGKNSLLTIEHLFYGCIGVNNYFTVDLNRPDGFIKFKSDSVKVKFAKDIIPTLPNNAFNNFKPIFNFIVT